MPIDEKVLQEKLASLEKELRELRKKEDCSLEQYRNDLDLQAIVERRLRNAAQSAIDIGRYILTEKGFRKPEDYGDVFNVLVEEDILTAETGREMVERAGLRNVLAHEYATIQNEETYRHLHALDPFERFAQTVFASFLKSGENSS